MSIFLSNAMRIFFDASWASGVRKHAPYAIEHKKAGAMFSLYSDMISAKKN